MLWECKHCGKYSNDGDPSCWGCGEPNPALISQNDDSESGKESQLKANTFCRNCGGRRIVPNALFMDSNRIQDVQPKLGIVVNSKSYYERPDPVAGEIRGSICCDCGLTQLFTDNLEEIWQAYEEDGGFETK